MHLHMHFESPEFRALYPFKHGVVYEWGQVVGHPFSETDGAVWVFALATPDDQTSGRYVPLDDLAKAQGAYIPDFGENFEHYSPMKDMMP